MHGSIVMLSTFAALSVNSAKHLCAQRNRPFATAQGDTWGNSRRGSIVMLSAAKHLCAQRDKPPLRLRVTV